MSIPLICVLTALIFKLFWCWPLFKIIAFLVLVPPFFILLGLAREYGKEEEEERVKRPMYLAVPLDFNNLGRFAEDLEQTKQRKREMKGDNYVMTIVKLKDGTERLCNFITWDEENKKASLWFNGRDTASSIIHYPDIDTVLVL